MVRPGPIDYFPGPDGSMVGIDADLARMFAAERKLRLRFVTVDTAGEIFATLGRGEAHIGAGGLLRPLAVKPAARVRIRACTGSSTRARGRTGASRAVDVRLCARSSRC